VAPTDSRGGAHHIVVWGDTFLRVALNCMWHLVQHPARVKL